MKEELLNKVDFNFIRYANCWEDADVLLKGLDAVPGARFLSIGSAGDNSFSLLATGADLVVAVDVNRIQLHLIELKKAAFKALDHQDFLEFLGFNPSARREGNFYKLRSLLPDTTREFLGFNPSARREGNFYKLRSLLPDTTREYWEAHIDQIKAGIIYQGKFEKYFSFFQRRILPLIHTEKRIEGLLKPKGAAEQERYYNDHWNNWRWRLFFRVFFNKYVMGKYGRDPEFMKEVKVPVSQFIFDKAEKHLKSIHAQDNYFLHFIHADGFGSGLPHYARAENFDKIKSSIDRIVVKEGFAQDTIAEYGQFDHMNLSNIFEYMNMETFTATSEQLADGCAAGGKMAYWNLMVPRRMSAILPLKLKFHEQRSKELDGIDKGFFYNSFITDEKL